MESYVADVIRIAHAATRLGALPGTADIIANIPKLADWLEHAVAQQEAYFYGQSVHMAQGMTPPSTQHVMLPRIASLSSVPAMSLDGDAWLDGQSLPDADATIVHSQAAS